MDEQNELLWRQYAQHIDLYKFYFEVTIKLTAFHYAITGAILSYYFTQPPDSMVRWALLLPVVLSSGLGFIFWRGASLLEITREDVFSLRDQLRLEVSPEFAVLVLLLKLFSAILGLTGLSALGLVVLR